MPELPEVETIRRGLEKKIKGLKISKVEVLLAKQFKGNPKDVEGAKITGVKRRGKINIIQLDNGKSLLIHLKLTGQVVYHKDGEKFVGGHSIPYSPGGNVLPSKTTHIIIHFSDGSQIFYNDIRQFGWIKVVSLSDLGNLSDLKKLGPEPLDKEFTDDYLQKIFAKTSKPVKLVLIDQEKIAGVGNIYANDALWEAKINPRRQAKQLKKEEITSLRSAVIKVLEEGLKYQGATGPDQAFINIEGNPGNYQEHFRVYQRNGEKCLRNDGGVIKRMEMGGRGTFFCPKCQK